MGGLGNSKHKAWPTWVRIFLVGTLAGLMNGMIGMGGGSIIVPGLIWAKRYNPRRAIITSLGAVFVQSLGGVLLHGLYSDGALLLSDVGLLVLIGALGAFFGSQIMAGLSGKWLCLIFGIFCLFSAQYLIASAFGWVVPLTAPREAIPLWGLILVGILSGLSSGLLGIGGGIVMMLGLTLVFNTPLLNAVLVALLMNVVNAGSGLVAHGVGRRLNLGMARDVMTLAPGAFIGVGVGFLFSKTLPGPWLQGVFGLFVVYVALSMLRKGFRDWSAERDKPAPVTLAGTSAVKGTIAPVERST